MARYKDIIGGLQILASCEPRGEDAFGVDAEHDIIYAGPETSEVNEANSQMLEALGWFKSDADRWAIYT